MKRALAMLVALAMVLALFAGCTPSSKPSNEDNPPSNPDDSQQGGQNSEEPIEIKWAARASIGILPDLNSDVKKLIEERYNVKITVEQVNIHDSEQYNLYWATGGSPTVLNMNNTAASVFKLVDQGAVREIPDGWLDQYMPNWMEANATNMGSMDRVKEMISYNGKDYIIPFSNPNHGYVMGIRQDWLDNLKLEMPTDADSLIEVLKAFTFNDPDGNGQDDTFGIHGGSQKGYMRFGYFQTQFNIWPTCFWDVDGQIIFTDTTEEYKDSLKYMRDIYSLGVVDPEFATEDRVVQRNKWASGKFGVIVDHPSWFDVNTGSNLTTILKENYPDAEISFIPCWDTIDGQKGKIVSFYPDCAGDGASFFGSTATDEQVKKVLEIYEDVFNDYDFWLRIDKGEEGIDWEFDENGQIKKTAEAEAGGDEYSSKKGFYSYVLRPLTDAFLSEHNLQPNSLTEMYAFADQYESMWVYTDFVQPASEAYNTYYADVKTLSDEFYYNGIMGKIDIDADWDSFQKSLQDAGLQKILDEYQKAVHG